MFVKRSVLFALLFLAFVAIRVDALPKDPQPLKITVLNPDGSPAAKASVDLYAVDFNGHRSVTLGEMSTDKAGIFEYHIAPDMATKIRDMAIEAVIRGNSTVAVASAYGPGPVTLAATTDIRVHVLGPDGKPLVQATVYPRDFFKRGGSSGMWDYSIDSPWTQTTDADGWAVFRGLPQGDDTIFEVSGDQYADTDWKYQVTLAQSNADIIMSVANGHTISGHVKYADTGKPVARNADVRAISSDNAHQGQATLDTDGNFSIKRLPLGAYQVTVDLWGNAPTWIAAPTAVTLTTTDAPPLEITLTHGAIVTGTVTAKGTRKPAAGVNIYTDQQIGYATTDASGKYSMRLPAGMFRITANSPGVTDGGYDGRDVQIVDGAKVTVDISVVPPKPSYSVSGIVVDRAGKPVAGAQIEVFVYGSSVNPVASGKDGGFAIPYPRLLAGSTICARRGTLSTAKPVVVGGPDVKLVVVPDAMVAIDGVVRDDGGKPARNVKVELYHETEQTGSQAGWTVTDANGRYRFDSQYAGATYMVSAGGSGLENAWSKEFTASTGRPMHVPLLTVARADSFVAGTVVDPSGNPVTGASVRDEQQDNAEVVTDKLGHFRLDGVPRKKVVLEVRAAEGRFASIEEPSGVDDVVIKVQSEAEEFAEADRFGKVMKADHSNHGNGENALKLLKADEAEAQTSGRKIFLIFHASWCGPCFVLHRFINDPKVKPVLDAHFVVQELDIWEHEKNGWENPGGAELYKKYGGPNSVPFFATLDANGKKLGDSMLNGDNTGDNLDDLLHTLKSADPRLTDEELSTLRSAMKVASTF